MRKLNRGPKANKTLEINCLPALSRKLLDAYNLNLEARSAPPVGSDSAQTLSSKNTDHMGVLHNISMALSGRTKRWNETNNTAVSRLFDFFGEHFSQEEALREMFQHFLAGSALSTSHLIYEGNPTKSPIRVDIKNLDLNAMIDAHVMGTQLYATMFSDINRDTLPLDTLHLILPRVFPDHGIIDSVASCAGGEKFDVAPYASTYFNNLAETVGAPPPSPLDWFASTPVVGMAFQVAVEGIKNKLG